VGRAGDLVGQRESGLVDGVEGDDALPDLLAVLGVADGGRVPRRGAQVQRVAAVAAAAKSGRKRNIYISFPDAKMTTGRRQELKKHRWNWMELEPVGDVLDGGVAVERLGPHHGRRWIGGVGELLLAGAPALALAAIRVGEGRVRRGESGV
jgi:hypothetical protein